MEQKVEQNAPQASDGAMEQMLQPWRNEQHVHMLFANMSEGFALGEAVFDAEDRAVDVRLLEVNDAFWRQLGLPHSSPNPIGLPLRDIIPGIEQFWLDRFITTALTGQEVTFENYGLATGRYYEVHAFQPEPGRVAVLFRDVTDRKATEQALRDSESRLRQIVTGVPGMMWAADADGQVNFVSPQWLAYTGMPERNPIEWLDVLHPDEREAVIASWRATVAEHRPWAMEYRLRRHDGCYCWFAARAIPIFDKNGRLEQWFGICTDIDALKRTQAQLAQSERRYSALFANRTNAIAHCRIIPDATGRPVDFCMECVNGACERILGVHREELETRRFTEIFPDISGLNINLIDALGRVGQEGGEVNFELFFEPNGQWLSMYAYSSMPGECTVIFSDITAQKNAEAELRLSEATLRATFEQAGVGITHLGPNGYYLRANRTFSKMVGYSEEELRHQHIRDITYTEDRELGMQDLQRAFAGEIDYFSVEKRYRCKSGNVIWTRVTATPVRDPQTGTVQYLVAVIEDITARRKAEQRALEAAQHDPLTGLPNRALIFEYAQHLMAATRRHHGQGAILFIDLDRFKPINDLYGHETGDRVLQEVGRRLAACVRDEDLVGRLGGDEFVIVLQHTDDGQSAATVAEHVMAALARPFAIGTLDLSISASIGISHFPQHGTDVDTLIRSADLAMYQTKQSNRGEFSVFTPELDQRFESTSSIEALLKHAVRDSNLILYYQPVIDMKSGRVIGAEALLRLLGHDGQIIEPNHFVPIAESTGLIGQIGEWVAMEACRQHDEWRQQGMAPTSIAINVSPLQFRHRGFAQRLQHIVQTSGVDPSCIQIEVTESTVMDNVDDAVQTLNGIRDVGIQIALDDFGTGYSSLSHLSHLPLDKLKVDQSFVQRLEHDRASRAITGAVIALGRTLNLEVVGEGIESEDALAYLQEHGCDQAQGFLISRPLPAAEFMRWYREHM